MCELCELLWARKFYFCSYSCTFISAHCICHSSMLVISLSYVSVQILQKSGYFCFRLPDPKGQRIMVVVYIAMTSQHFSNVTCPNILVDVVSSDHRVCSNNDSTLDSTSHATAHDNFTRPCRLVAGYLHRYNNCRCYCWAEKLILCRNWTLQTKPTIYTVSMSVANTTTA